MEIPVFGVHSSDKFINSIFKTWHFPEEHVYLKEGSMYDLLLPPGIKGLRYFWYNLNIWCNQLVHIK